MKKIIQQEKLKKVLSSFIDEAEQRDVYSLTQLVDEIKLALTENGFTDQSEKVI